MSGFTELLTIAIPCYERDAYFQEALDSALEQSLQCQVIVCDNGSSHDHFQRWSERHGERVRYYRNAENLGMWANWNLCYQRATTPYVMVLGDDDVMHKDYVATFVQAQQQHPDIAAFFTEAWVLKEGEGLRETRFVFPAGYNAGWRLLEHAVAVNMAVPTVTMALSRELQMRQGYREAPHGSNDWRWLFANIATHQVYGSHERLLHYRYHDGNDCLATEVLCLVSQLPIIVGIGEQLSEAGNRHARLAESHLRKQLRKLLGMPAAEVAEVLGRDNEDAAFCRNLLLQQGLLSPRSLMSENSLRRALSRLQMKIRVDVLSTVLRNKLLPGVPRLL